ncbi:TrkH family potassium uptake protein [bacterium]|nr:TrkH family potassium uptake protein [bacterium]
MNIRGVGRVLGFLLLVTAGAQVLPLIVDLIYGEGDWDVFLLTGVCGAVAGAGLMFLGRTSAELRHREGFAIVTLGWMAVGLLGAVPFLLSGTITSVTDAVFESISGFTTTGSTIMTDIEGVGAGHHAVLFWRSLTQWLGGMGIVVLALAILPLLGVGGMQLFRAEAPGPSPDRLTSRISETARLLWGVYLLITLLEVLLLVIIGGMSPYDAVCHAFTTMATGGFSTLDASVGGFGSPAVEWIVTLFMFLAGINFSLHYVALKGKPQAYWRDEEFRFYSIVMAGATLLVLAVLIPVASAGVLSDKVRAAAFQVVSIGTTTGYGTADYVLWPPLTHAVLLLLMALGGCAGSTGGGIKMMRVLLLLKHAHMEVKKLVHPRAIYTLWFNERSLPSSLAPGVLGFLLLYMMVFVFGMLALTLTGRDIVTAVGATAATLGNIGPGLGDVGPAGNFAFMNEFEKWLLTLFMLIGRLELYTVLVLLLPSTWRKT